MLGKWVSGTPMIQASLVCTWIAVPPAQNSRASKPSRTYTRGGHVAICLTNGFRRVAAAVVVSITGIEVLLVLVVVGFAIAKRLLSRSMRQRNQGDGRRGTKTLMKQFAKCR